MARFRVSRGNGRFDRKNLFRRIPGVVHCQPLPQGNPRYDRRLTSSYSDVKTATIWGVGDTPLTHLRLLMQAEMARIRCETRARELAREKSAE